MKRILITGGAGFIGRHLCRHLLLDETNHVICLDNNSTSNQWNLSKEPRWVRRVELVYHDVCEPWHIDCDQIYHLSCPASPVQYKRNPVRTIETAVLGPRNALKLARDTGARLLITSTSEIYGDPLVNPQPESYYGNVNPIGERSCYDSETELLTDSGWILFSKLSPENKIATRTPIGTVEYHVPSEFISKKYSGDLFIFRNNKIDIRVTPDHKLYVLDRFGKNGRLVRADSNIDWRHSKIPSFAKFIGNDTEYMFFGSPPRNAKKRLPLRIKMDDWLEFLGWYITEGSCYENKRTRVIKGKKYVIKNWAVMISQQKIENRKKIINCLRRIGFKFYIEKAQFRICNKQLYELLAPLGKAGDKFIPREYLNLSLRQSKILLDTLILGGGTIKRNNNVCYYSKSKKLSDDVQELVLRCGFASCLSSPPPKASCYRINIRLPRYVTGIVPKLQKYEGLVYCVNVPNHVICIRRSGKAIWCGNCYDEGKRCGEALAASWAKQYGTDVRIARLFNVYGQGMDSDDGRLLPNVIKAIRQNQPIPIYGDGNQTRSWCYVRDTVKGLCELMNSNNPKLGNPAVVNIGNPHEISINDIVKIVVSIMKPSKEPEIEYLPMTQDDPKIRCPDISKALEVLNWKPEVTLYDGLYEMIFS